LFALRLVYGLALGCFTTASGAYLADVAPAARRGEAASYWGLVNPLGMGPHHYTHLGCRFWLSERRSYTVPIVNARRCRMSTWVAEEMAESQMHDARHARRLTKLLSELSKRPVSSIPSACHGWAETVAVYRFLDNPSVGCEEILSGHKQ